MITDKEQFMISITKDLIDQKKEINSLVKQIRKDIKEYAREDKIKKELALLALQMDYFKQLILILKEETENFKA